jgi:hypothetical protein
MLQDKTEEGFATYLVAQGVPKRAIVLAYFNPCASTASLRHRVNPKAPAVRRLYPSGDLSFRDAIPPNPVREHHSCPTFRTLI